MITDIESAVTVCTYMCIMSTNLGISHNGKHEKSISTDRASGLLDFNGIHLFGCLFIILCIYLLNKASISENYNMLDLISEPKSIQSEFWIKLVAICSISSCLQAVNAFIVLD